MTALTCRLVDPGDIDGLDRPWSRLLAHSRFDDVFASAAYARAWRRTLGADATPRVVVVEDADDVRLVASLTSTRDDPGTWRFAGARRADYTALVHSAGDLAAVRALVAGLARAGSGCERLVLRNLPAESDVLRAFPLAVEAGGWRERLPSLLDRPLVTTHHDAIHPYVDRAGLTAHRGQLTESKNTLRKVRVLTRTGEVRFTSTTEPEQVATDLGRFFSLHRLGSAAQGRPSAFEDPQEEAFVRALVEELAPRRAVRLDQLHAGDDLVAAHLGFEWGRRVGWYKPCFDPAHSKASPGRLLLLHVMADTLDRGFDELDLLKGEEGYKSEFATGVRPTGGLDLYRTRRAWLQRRGLAWTKVMVTATGPEVTVSVQLLRAT